MKDYVNQLIKNGNYNDILAILKGSRNGAVYGAKIRFPHALVMTVLFRRTNLKDMARTILKATYQHARNLATFVPIYKALLLGLKKLKGKEDNLDSFVAGVIGGYLVFGTDNPVNNQIVLYLFSRISVGLARLLVKRNVIPAPSYSFPLFSAITWGIVMWLFRHDRDVLQGSLQSSMQYLYNDSDIFSDFDTLLLRNQ
ncbi:Tim17/Tim22/Tim23/Pmp24 family-domain-containing protein [Gorgonomyces haynaldii]|nr:Tim17/Tim22/Tim23/Pmp24 family-domain-containing protein [Gorgonomyces haynaldii]